MLIVLVASFVMQVNGSEGIGTGWSSSVPNYNPLDIIENIRRKIQGEVRVHNGYLKSQWGNSPRDSQQSRLVDDGRKWKRCTLGTVASWAPSPPKQVSEKGHNRRFSSFLRFSLTSSTQSWFRQGGGELHHYRHLQPRG